MDLDLQFVPFTHALTGIVNEPMISYEYMISLGLAHCFFHRPFFANFISLFRVLPFSFLCLCFKSSILSVNCCHFDIYFSLFSSQSSDLPISIPLPFSFHLFLPLYFFLNLLYHCSALASTPVLPLLLALTLSMPLFLPFSFFLVTSLS